MKKVILTYGLISGAIVAALMFISMPLWENGTINFDNGEYVGYTTMVIALSLIFFGVKSYRDNHQNGTITFWQGTKIGLMITLIAAVMYAMAWEVSLQTTAKNFVSNMTEHYVEKARKEGAGEEKIKETEAYMANVKELYKNPVLRFGITMMEILPVGIVITLLSAALLRRKEVLPATN